jgi:hypothetical protein
MSSRLVIAVVAGLLAVSLLAAGGALLWGNAQKDDGYFTTARERFATASYALATDNLDINLEGAGWIMDRDDLGQIRLEVRSQADEPAFVGIARTSDVSEYLSGTQHTSLVDVDYSPFRASYRDHKGGRRPASPADQRIWAASAHGPGTQTLTWDLEDGHWSVVVMNEDGSRGVDARISAGAKVPFLATAGWVSIGAGLLLLTGTCALLARLARRTGNRSTVAA